jgi:hypothetical protein
MLTMSRWKRGYAYVFILSSMTTTFPQNAALKAIDEALSGFGKSHLVARQPVASKASQTQMSATNLGSTAGPFKRGRPPVALGPNEVKVKKSCKLGCGQIKHALEDCPVVRAGPLA